MGSSENWAYALGEGMLGWRDDLEKLSMELELEGGEPDIEICYSGFILYRQGFGGPLMIARDACTRWAAIGGKVKRFQVSAKHSSQSGETRPLDTIILHHSTPQELLP